MLFLYFLFSFLISIIVSIYIERTIKFYKRDALKFVAWKTRIMSHDTFFGPHISFVCLHDSPFNDPRPYSNPHKSGTGLFQKRLLWDSPSSLSHHQSHRISSPNMLLPNCSDPSGDVVGQELAQKRYGRVLSWELS